MTARIAAHYAVRAAICRAYALGRVDQSFKFAAKELLRMADEDPDLTPLRVLRLYGDHLPFCWRAAPADWDHALWALADVWCELYRRLEGLPPPRAPSPPYSVLFYALPPRPGVHPTPER